MAKYDGTLDNDELSIYDIKETMKSLNIYFNKYRILKEKRKFYSSSISSPLGNDNMGIFSSDISNPTQARAEQMIRISKFLDEVDRVIKNNERKLNNDEKIIFRGTLLRKHSDEDIIEELNVGKNKYYDLKKSCYVKVATWYDLEVYDI